MSIVFGRSVVDWMEQRLGEPFRGEALGLGLVRSGMLVAGVAFHDRQYHNVHASIVALPGSLTKQFMKAIFHYPFNQLKVNRITVCVRRSNEASSKLAQRMGFSLEGIQRKGYPDGEDKFIFGMLKEECKWIS